MNNTFYTFEQYIDLSNIKDSLQLESGQTIAELKTQKGVASLEVRGLVRVLWKEEEEEYPVCYTNPSDFPKELKELIASDDKWFENDRLYIDDNNWFELFFTKYDEDGTTSLTNSDVVDAEEMTPREIQDMILEYLF